MQKLTFDRFGPDNGALDSCRCCSIVKQYCVHVVTATRAFLIHLLLQVFACNVTLFQQLIPAAAAAVEFPARVHCPFPKLSVNSSAIKTTLNYKSLRGDKKSKK